MSFQHFHTQSKLTAWYPTNIPGCLLWLDASQGITKDASDYISAWADQSGNGNNATQGTGSAQPLYIANQLNGKPVVRFNGTSNFMKGTTISGLGASSVDIFIITQGNSQTPNDIRGTIFVVNDYNGLWLSRISKGYATGNINNYLGGTNLYSNDYNYFANTFYWKIIELWHNKNVLTKLLFNNYQEKTATLGTFTDANYYLGYGGLLYQTYYSGDIAEIIVYNSALSDSDRKLLGNYLALKYTTPLVFNEIPIMTSDTTPSGIVTYNNTINGTKGYMAFDNNDATYVYQSSLPAFIDYELPVAKKFTSYFIKSYGTNSPYNWTIQGSNDGSNWTVLDTRTGQECASGNAYYFPNTNYYTHYKIVITAAYNNNPTIKTLMFSE